MVACDLCQRSPVQPGCDFNVLPGQSEDVLALLPTMDALHRLLENRDWVQPGAVHRALVHADPVQLTLYTNLILRSQPMVAERLMYYFFLLQSSTEIKRILSHSSFPVELLAALVGARRASNRCPACAYNAVRSWNGIAEEKWIQLLTSAKLVKEDGLLFLAILSQLSAEGWQRSAVNSLDAFLEGLLSVHPGAADYFFHQSANFMAFLILAVTLSEDLNLVEKIESRFRAELEAARKAQEALQEIKTVAGGGPRFRLDAIFAAARGQVHIRRFFQLALWYGLLEEREYLLCLAQSRDLDQTKARPIDLDRRSAPRFRPAQNRSFSASIEESGGEQTDAALDNFSAAGVSLTVEEKLPHWHLGDPISVQIQVGQSLWQTDGSIVWLDEIVDRKRHLGIAYRKATPFPVHWMPMLLPVA